MEELIIKIGIKETIGIIVSVCGGLLAIAWWVGNKFGELGADIKGLDTRLTNIETNSSGLIKHSSPLSLTEGGISALEKSGLKGFIDNKKNELLEDCKKNHKTETAYDVQISAFDYFDKINFDADFEKRLENFAFQEGADMNIVRRLGGIYFRDVCLDILKMNQKDINGKK